MTPEQTGLVHDLPGMNVSYDRAALEAIDDLLREGRWEGQAACTPSRAGLPLVPRRRRR